MTYLHFVAQVKIVCELVPFHKMHAVFVFIVTLALLVLASGELKYISFVLRIRVTKIRKYKFTERFRMILFSHKKQSQIICALCIECMQYQA